MPSCPGRYLHVHDGAATCASPSWNTAGRQPVLRLFALQRGDPCQRRVATSRSQRRGGRCRTSQRYEVPAASITVNRRPSPGKASETPVGVLVHVTGKRQTQTTPPCKELSTPKRDTPHTLDVAEALRCKRVSQSTTPPSCRVRRSSLVRAGVATLEVFSVSALRHEGVHAPGTLFELSVDASSEASRLTKIR